MSYDLYCYKSTHGVPNEDEADEIISKDTEKWVEKPSNAQQKLAIVKALTSFNPRLEAFDFDYGEIARLPSITVEEAKRKFHHIELNPPDGDLAIQLIVYDNHVSITVPYWYQGEKAKRLFAEIEGYINTIFETAGYFVYDPQKGVAFDPSVTKLNGLTQYLSTSDYAAELTTSAQPKKEM